MHAYRAHVYQVLDAQLGDVHRILVGVLISESHASAIMKRCLKMHVLAWIMGWLCRPAHVSSASQTPLTAACMYNLLFKPESRRLFSRILLEKSRLQ
jgi:hypothetical protein